MKNPVLSIIFPALMVSASASADSRLLELAPDRTVEAQFPQGEFTPNGYWAHPCHTPALNRRGVLRSVPPLGIGFFAKPLPWPYGGATFPTLLIRNIIGFRELTSSESLGFHSTPALSPMLFQQGKTYETNNLSYWDIKLNFSYTPRGDEVETRVQFTAKNYDLYDFDIEEKASFRDFL